MIRAFYTALETSLSAALLLGGISALFLGRPGASRDRGAGRVFALLCGAGVLSALVISVLRRTTAINRGMVNAWALGAAIGSSGMILGSLFHHGPQGQEDGKHRLPVFLVPLYAALLLFYSLPDLFLMPSDFVLAGQAVFSTEFLAKLCGAAAGALAAALAGLGVFRGGLVSGGDLRGARLFRLCVALLLLVNTADQAARLTQFLMARRVIPLYRPLFRLVMGAVNNGAVFRFALGGVAALIPAAALVLAAGPGARAGLGASLNPAQRRKAKEERRRVLRQSAGCLALFCLVFLSLTALKAWDERGAALSPPEPMTVLGAEILVPVERFEDGRLHRFAWNASDGTEVRFIVIKKSPSAYGVGLDACDICGNTGYYERRDGVVCRLCDVVMNKSTIGFKGGCNPVPLAYRIREGAMVVALSDLESEKGRFK
ncbi:MAG: Fe-S-containing protein [Spirochaetaceae bacterium]|jgi:uncharacterized membrane protein|nr:Fe-S-containing protein [Spirochaetaceae bacterium]